ncbi:MAG: pyruvate, phosphate dikinase, partial [Candidatus Omnitrophota bacterium]|nr:pyruvate, phosphate dikinase [Candidatus Omnitrophota bacterium]
MTKRTRIARTSRAAGGKKSKRIFSFGAGRADGRSDMKQLLGGKGANLAEMTNLGVPVPPGLTMTTEVCREFYELGQRWPKGLETELRAKMAWLESITKKGFGDPKNPLLVSVRSGAAVSMPGMMDTILNLGLNEQTVRGLIAKTDNPRFAYDAYRRFIQMYSNVVLELEHKKFEEKLAAAKARARVLTDAELPADTLKQLVADYKQLIRAQGKEFPEDPMEQLRGSINAVFNSWNNQRAIIYRRLNNISGLGGTAVNIQSMVFGNMGPTSLTGVCFTRDPGTGKNVFYGEYLVNAQGEDVVAGIRTPKPVAKMKAEFPKIYSQLYRIGKHLEKYFKEVQDVEFTVEDGVLYMLQCRTGKRTAGAAVAIATDFVREGLISRDKALLRIDPAQLDQLLHPTIDPKAKPNVIAKGLPASPGAAAGKVVFDAHRAVELTEEASERVILVRQETSPEDIEGMAAAQGILTARGGMTCVGSETLLLTPDGFHSARALFQAIEAGARPLLLAFDHRTLQPCWRRVIAAGCRHSDTIRVEVSQTGRAHQNTLELTSDHKMFTIHQRRLVKKRLAQCVADDDFLCTVDRLPGRPEAAGLPDIDPYLVGALLTDGCIRLWGRKGSVTFTQKSNAEKETMIAAVRESFQESFGDPFTYHRTRTSTSVLRGRPIVGTADDFISFRREPAEQLTRLSNNIVAWVLGLSEGDLLRFLAGVADGDGTYVGRRVQLYIGKEALLRGVVAACLRLGVAPQVTRNRTIFHVQLVERVGDILFHSYRLSGTVSVRKYGSKLFSTRALFGDVVKSVDRQGRVGSAVKRNVLYSTASIQRQVLPHCSSRLKADVEPLLASALRMVRAVQTTSPAPAWVYNFEVLAEDDLDKNFIAFTSFYSPVLVSNSHAAVVARGMGKCCVVGCSDITVREDEHVFRAGDQLIKEGDYITLNGTTGDVILGEVPLIEPQLTSSFKQLLAWADQTRRLGVRANADTPHDAKVARDFGAEGIGLCRTEHMFFGEERLP